MHSLNISGQHIEVTEALRNYVKERLARLDDHMFKITSIHVVLSVEKIRHIAKANVHIKGANLHAEASEEDMYAAIDCLGDKLHRQAIKHKEKVISHQQGNGEEHLR
jgi:putative sigma-54 modulation protein